MAGEKPNFRNPLKEQTNSPLSPGKLEVQKDLVLVTNLKQRFELQSFMGNELSSKNVKQKGQLRSAEEIAKLLEKNDSTGLGEKIAKLALKTAEKRLYKPESCWDWADHIYGKARAHRREIYKNFNYKGKDCKDVHASAELMDMIRPGDWIYYNNKNTDDKKGNHTAIFIEWVDKENYIARFASGSAENKGITHVTDLKEKPVTYIAKPS